MDPKVIARLLSMSSFDHLNVLIKAKDEDLLELNDLLTQLPQTVIEGTAHADLYQSVVTEIYGRWVAQAEAVAVKEEKWKNGKPHWEMTKEEKDEIASAAWEKIQTQIIQLQLDTNRLYRFKADCNPVESECPAATIVGSTFFTLELVEDLGE